MKFLAAKAIQILVLIPISAKIKTLKINIDFHYTCGRIKTMNSTIKKSNFHWL